MTVTDSAETKKRKQQVAKTFDGAAPTYGQVGPKFFSHFGRRLVEIAQIPPQATVLDIATGRGAVLYPALEAVGSEGKVVGIDLSEQMVQEISKELTNQPFSSNVEIHQMDAEYLQFADETFDYVLCGFAIFFFPQLFKAMAEFRRVLKPGGKICVTTFDGQFENEWNWLYEIVQTYLPTAPQENLSPDPNASPRPVFNTPEGVKAILNSAGFGDTKVYSETAEFVYATAEELWATLWSHGMREALEAIEQAVGSEGLQNFKLAVFEKVGSMLETDGLHQLFAVHISLATKP